MAVQHGTWKIGDTPQPLAVIRLGSETLLDDLKDLVRIHGLGYQPLMKQILTQFVEAEKKRLLREEAARVAGGEDTDPVPDKPRAACG